MDLTFVMIRVKSQSLVVLNYGLQHGAVVGIPFEIDYVGMQVMSNKVCGHSVVT